jgi:hypothetical protein
VTACVLDHGDQRGEAVDGLLLCPRHLRQLTDDCTEIGLLIVDSQRITDGGAPADNSPRTRKLKRADPPAPANLTLVAMYDARTKMCRIPGTVADPLGDQSEPLTDVLGIIAAHTDRLIDERNLTTAPASVLAQLDLLKRHCDWLARQPWVAELLDELRQVRRALRVAVRDRAFFRVGTCHLVVDDVVCGGALLVENGTEPVFCKSCGATWADPAARARLAMI